MRARSVRLTSRVGGKRFQMPRHSAIADTYGGRDGPSRSQPVAVTMERYHDAIDAQTSRWSDVTM